MARPGTLEIEGVIGFDGDVPQGLIAHPDEKHLIYAMGCVVVIEEISTVKKNREKKFLSLHDNRVTSLAVSKSGRYIASGQLTHSGFKTDVIIWDYHKLKQYAKLSLHKNKVEALAFSPNDKYLVTLGGKDDGCVVVWDIARRQAICGSNAQCESDGITKTVAFANNSDYVFVTGGEYTLRVWELNVEQRKIIPAEVTTRKNRRIINCIAFDENDQYIYCGTSTGDILTINCESKILQDLGPRKNLFCQGVSALVRRPNGEFIVGAGDGTVAIFSPSEKEFKKAYRTYKLDSEITSITLRGKQGHQIYAGTCECQIYCMNPQEDKPATLISTCHRAPINHIDIPKGSSHLVVTCSYADIRIWNLESKNELLRITVPNQTCNTVCISPCATIIFSGWNDGRIRAFYPKSGKVMFTMEDAHKKEVTSLAVMMPQPNSQEAYLYMMYLISGGKDGHVRQWGISKSSSGSFSYTQLKDLCEHKGTVTAIDISKDQEQCVTSCLDGSCIVWNTNGWKRSKMIQANTLFKGVCYHPDPNRHSILTCGTDRQICYWSSIEDSSGKIRDIEGSATASINTLALSSDGQFGVVAGDDKEVKMFDYEAGEITHVGKCHGAEITTAKMSPCNNYIVTASTDGGIVFWQTPRNCHRQQQMSF